MTSKRIRLITARWSVAVGVGVGLAAWGLAGGLASATPGPTLTVTPNSGLADTATVSVSGSGYTANSSFGIYQCKGGPFSGTCRLVTSVSADSNGEFVASITVLRVFTSGGGSPIDCGPEDDCFVLTNDPNFTGASISFASVATTTTTVPGPTCGGRAATIVGTSAGETIQGTPGPDVIVGLGGGDTIYGAGANDVICAGAGHDTVYGGPGADKVFGQGGNDGLNGNVGNDNLSGGPGDDALNGGADSDTCTVGSGTNTKTNCES